MSLPARPDAADLMRARTVPLRLVIFDCDGVIVDSERISAAVLARDFSARGWALTAAEAEHLFVGTTLPDIRALAEARFGFALPGDWSRAIAGRIVAAMASDAVAIPGAIEALRAVTAMGLPWRVASNSSHAELDAKFGRLGIAALVAGRVLSHQDVARGKPAPDLFLAAAAAEGVAPAECVVIEDSVTGATAARAAGMDCLGYDRATDGAALRAVGAATFHDMAALASLIALALEHVA